MESYEMAKSHFDKLNSSPEGRKEISKFNGTIQFDLKDEESFYIEIEGGKVFIKKGKPQVEPQNVITFVTDKATVRDIFHKGQLYPGISDFMFEGRVWVIGSKSGSMMGRKDEKPIAAWASKLLRMHV